MPDTCPTCGSTRTHVEWDDHDVSNISGKSTFTTYMLCDDFDCQHRWTNTYAIINTEDGWGDLLDR